MVSKNALKPISMPKKEVFMRVIKKYANRKLYDTVEKTYISMDRLADLIKEGEEISVIDNQTDQDITVSILSQLLAREKREGDSEELSDMLSNLLRKGSDAVFGYAKKYGSKWQNAMSMAEDEIEKVSKIVFKGRDAGEEDRKNLIQGLMGQADKLKHWIGDKVDQRMNDMMGAMKLVTREEMKTMIDAVAALEQRVRTLEMKPENAQKNIDISLK